MAVRCFLKCGGLSRLLALACAAAFPAIASAAEATAALAAAARDSALRFDVRAYVINCNPAVFTNAPTPELSGRTGTNVSLEQIVQAASEVLSEFQKQGYPKANVAVAQEQITNGIVTMNVYQGAFPQILVSGKPWSPVEDGIAPLVSVPTAKATNAPTAAKTNALPHFEVKGYEVSGNTLLPGRVFKEVLLKHIGTNVTMEDIRGALSDLQLEYRNRGFPTVNVTLPQQSVTNGLIQMRVFEGRLAEILVKKNHYFSSNNVVRALPSLRTNTMLNGPLFQAELDRANANRDRQIYPELRPGPETNTTALFLMVKDRLPLHAKLEFNNQSSPGTPDLRVNGSAVYDNLWQLEHSLGVQYSYSPEQYKTGNQWSFYDRPLVANYSAFYRLPLAGPESEQAAVESRPGSFGYDEASRKFRLPPPSGVPELNLYASRSTIDTGVQSLGTQDLYDIPNVRTITRQDDQQDLTINNSLGFRLSAQLPEMEGVVSTVSGGLDFKTYTSGSFKTNNFNFYEVTLNELGNPNPPVISEVSSPVPATYNDVHYLPLTIRWEGSRKDAGGLWTGSFGYSVNFSGGLFAPQNRADNRADFQRAAGSSHADGYYQILTGSLARDQVIYKDWRLVLRADGQWANQPLLSNEQFGVGGVGSVRGYHEGELFGDTGWHVSLEQKTPAHVAGSVGGKYPLVFRGSFYMDYAERYLLDPQGRPGRASLWGTGLGVVASIGANWEARFLFSLPLLSTSDIEAYQPFFNFSLTAQF